MAFNSIVLFRDLQDEIQKAKKKKRGFCIRTLQNIKQPKKQTYFDYLQVPYLLFIYVAFFKIKFILCQKDFGLSIFIIPRKTKDSLVVSLFSIQCRSSDQTCVFLFVNKAQSSLRTTNEKKKPLISMQTTRLARAVKSVTKRSFSSVPSSATVVKFQGFGDPKQVLK